MSEMKYDCSSCTTNNFYFVAVKNFFCMGCIRYFCQKYTFLFPSVAFRLVDFCVYMNIVKMLKKIYMCDCFWISPVPVWK